MLECIYVTLNNVKHFAGAGIIEADLPTKNLSTGSSCLMLDSGDKYIFHKGTGKWYRQKKSSSGESGGGDSAPVKGVDYWTEADKAEIKAYVDEAIIGGAW